MVAKRVLDTLIELSGKRRDEAAGQAADARRVADRMLAMQQQLRQYRADYDGKAPTRLAQRTEVQRIEQHAKFVARLDYAIDDQGRRHEQALAVQARQEEALRERQKRLKAFETLRQRREQAQAQREARQEQRATDEQAARIHHHRRTRT